MLVLHYFKYQSYLPILWMTILDFNVRSSQIDSTDIFIYHWGMYHHLGRYCKFLQKKISKSPMLISSVLEKCIKTLFFPHRGGNFRSKLLSRQPYQNATNHVFEKRKDNCFRNYEILEVLIKYNSIIRNDIEENIQFYRVVRVIPKKTVFKFININKIHTNINDSKLSFRK